MTVRPPERHADDPVRAHHVVDDATGRHPVRVMAIVAPETAEDVAEALRRTQGPVSIGGGRFSTGGQVASPGSLHLDMRAMNRILEFSPERRTITVQPGVRWCDIQRFVDPHGLSVRVMQPFANFTVGGALGVNCHGGYVGAGPLVRSVRALKVALHDGRIVACSRDENDVLFFGVVGGYGGLGVVVEAELDLAAGACLRREDRVLPLDAWVAHFRDTVRDDPKAVLHEARLYAPRFATVRAVTWVETDQAPTQRARLREPRRAPAWSRALKRTVAALPFEASWRERVADPLDHLRHPVQWRNFVAGRDVAEVVPPPGGELRGPVLQELLVPIDRLAEFVQRMGEVLRRHRVQAVEVTLRHALPDPDTMLSWAPVETIAVALLHRPRPRDPAHARVGVWARELVDAVLAVGGTYALPYQAHATPEQFHRAYPCAPDFFALKRAVDPQFRFTNALWDAVYAPWLSRQVASAAAAAAAATAIAAAAANEAPENAAGDDTDPAAATVATVAELPAPVRPTRAPAPTDFHRVFGDVRLSDAFYRFLQTVHRAQPEDRLHPLIARGCALHRDEEALYRWLQRELPGITPGVRLFGRERRAVRTDQGVTALQVVEALRRVGKRDRLVGYLELGTQGAHHATLRRRLKLAGPAWFVDEPATDESSAGRRGLFGRAARRAPAGHQVALGGWAPLADAIPDASLDLVACLGGLHDVPPARLAPFLASIHRVLRPGGVFLLREHDVRDDDAQALVSLAHTVRDATSGRPWEVHRDTQRCFVPVTERAARLADAGFDDAGARLVLAHDPTDHTLMAFVRRGPVAASGATGAPPSPPLAAVPRRVAA